MNGSTKSEIGILKPLSITATETGMVAELSREDVEAFLGSNPPDFFHVDGVPVSASADLIREVLFPVEDTSPSESLDCPAR